MWEMLYVRWSYTFFLCNYFSQTSFCFLERQNKEQLYYSIYSVGDMKKIIFHYVTNIFFFSFVFFPLFDNFSRDFQKTKCKNVSFLRKKYPSFSIFQRWFMFINLSWYILQFSLAVFFQHPHRFFFITFSSS